MPAYTFIRDAKFNRYFAMRAGRFVAYVHGRPGYWRAYVTPNGIVREARTRDLAVERVLRATDSPVGRPWIVASVERADAGGELWNVVRRVGDGWVEDHSTPTHDYATARKRADYMNARRHERKAAEAAPEGEA